MQGARPTPTTHTTAKLSPRPGPRAIAAIYTPLCQQNVDTFHKIIGGAPSSILSTLQIMLLCAPAKRQGGREETTPTPINPYIPQTLDGLDGWWQLFLSLPDAWPACCACKPHAATASYCYP